VEGYLVYMFLPIGVICLRYLVGTIVEIYAPFMDGSDIYCTLLTRAHPLARACITWWKAAGPSSTHPNPIMSHQAEITNFKILAETTHRQIATEHHRYNR
jgi:hypothetical protein